MKLQSATARWLAAAALAQVVSLLLAAGNLFSALLSKKGASLPATQSTSNYVLLAIVYGTCYIVYRARGGSRKLKWHYYPVLALLDVQAAVFILLAYRFTSITSVTLLDCASIPCVILLSAWLLKAQYRNGHWCGALLCVVGLVCVVVTDDKGAGPTYANPALGDGLVLLGALLCACANVTEERLLHDAGIVEVLAFMGAFGAAWSGLYLAVFEVKALLAAPWSKEVLALHAGYTLAMFGFYSLTPIVLLLGGAALFNLSLLTSDLWAAVARIAYLGGFAGSSGLYFGLSFAMVAVGLAVFTASGGVYTEASPCYALILSRHRDTSPDVEVKYWSPHVAPLERGTSDVSKEDAPLKNGERDSAAAEQLRIAPLPSAPANGESALALGGRVSEV